MPFGIMSVLFLVLFAFGSWWLGKKIPMLVAIVDIAVMVWLLATFLSLGNITVLAELLAKLSWMKYLLAAAVGMTIGGWIAKLF